MESIWDPNTDSSAEIVIQKLLLYDTELLYLSWDTNVLQCMKYFGHAIDPWTYRSTCDCMPAFWVNVSLHPGSVHENLTFLCTRAWRRSLLRYLKRWPHPGWSQTSFRLWSANKITLRKRLGVERHVVYYEHDRDVKLNLIRLTEKTRNPRNSKLLVWVYGTPAEKWFQFDIAHFCSFEVIARAWNNKHYKNTSLASISKRVVVTGLRGSKKSKDDTFLEIISPWFAASCFTIVGHLHY